MILNPTAGSAENTADLRERLLGRLPGCDIQLTSQPGDAEKFATDAAAAGCGLIVAAGGDGTLNEVINGIAERDSGIRVGLIALGTGNDFARSIDLPTNVDGCLDVILAGHTQAIDMVRVTSDRVRYFINVSAGGFSGIVDEKLTPEMKRTWGPLAYLRSAAAAFSELRAYATEIVFDSGETLSLNLYNVVIGNGRYVAGGIPVAPEALLDDGAFDMILIPQTPTTDLAVLVTQILLGKHLSNEMVLYRRAAKVAVRSKPGMWFNVDGELVGNEPATFEVMAGAVQFVIAGK